MTTMAIAAVLLGLAAPSMSTFIKNNRLTTQNTELLAALRLARTEAIRRQDRVEVCVDTDTSDNDCEGTNWALGWRIWSDTDGDGTVDTDEVIRVHGALAGGNTLTTAGLTTSSKIGFDREGRSDSSGTFTLCDSRGADYAKGIIVNQTGQVRAALDQKALDGTTDLSCP